MNYKNMGFVFCFLLSAMKAYSLPESTVDPLEKINRQIYKFNVAFDATVLKPPAKLYKAMIPGPIREGVNNFYNNIHMLTTIANDLLQVEGKYAIKDSWRFLVNSTLGLGGFIDVAKTFSLPPHSNDLGLTFAKWGFKKSPYIVVPFIGPSTIRDGIGMLGDYTFLSPYPYVDNQVVLYSLLGLRYVDLRSQFLETDPLIKEAFDPYTFVRDAYLQNRHFQLTGEQQTSSDALEESEEANALGADYVEEGQGSTVSTVNSDLGADYVEESNS